MLFSDADGQKVVSTATAATIGKVHDYVIDPQGPKVAALLLKKTDEGDTLRWADIVAFGADAVTVDSADKITKGGDDLAPLLEKRNHLHKKRVLSTIGDELGTVKDIDFDPSTGTVTSLILDDKGKTEVAGSRVVGVGSYAVVVEAETAPGAPPATPAVGAPAMSAPPVDTSPSSDEPTSLDLTSQADTGSPITLTPPDLSQAQRASYPPAE